MKTVFDKLNLKNVETILVLNPPAAFEAEIARLDAVAVLRNAGSAERVEFALAFVTTRAEIEAIAPVVVGKAPGDAAVWFAYPKGSSKRRKSEINRDRGWQILGELGFEAVRQITVDEDWSALRFRRVEYIKSFRRARSRAMTKAGRERASARDPKT